VRCHRCPQASWLRNSACRRKKDTHRHCCRQFAQSDWSSGGLRQHRSASARTGATLGALQTESGPRFGSDPNETQSLDGGRPEIGQERAVVEQPQQHGVHKPGSRSLWLETQGLPTTPDGQRRRGTATRPCATYDRKPDQRSGLRSSWGAIGQQARGRERRDNSRQPPCGRRIPDNPFQEWSGCPLSPATRDLNPSHRSTRTFCSTPVSPGSEADHRCASGATEQQARDEDQRATRQASG
jgi:hypothetical protein